MKTTNKMIYALLFAGAFASCQKDQIGGPGQDELAGKVNFTLSASNGGPSFRTGHAEGDNGIIVTWEQGDRIGLFSHVDGEAKNANTIFSILEESDISNEGKNAVFSGELSQSADWSMNFYAYYPRISIQNADATKVPVSVLGQVQEGRVATHLSQYDVLVADPAIGVQAGDDDTNLHFRHVMAIADFEISLPAADEPVDILEVKILRPEGRRVQTSGTLDLTAADEADRLAITSTEAQSSYALKLDIEDVALAAGESFTARLALFPADWTGETVSFYVTTSAGTYQFNRPGIQLEAGKRYKSELVLENTIPVAVGDYYYADGTWSTTLDATKKVVGIVAYIGQNGGAINGYVVSLENRNDYPPSEDPDAPKNVNGKGGGSFDIPEVPNLPRLTNPTRPDGEDWEGKAHAAAVAAKRTEENYNLMYFILDGVDYVPADITEGPAALGNWYTPAVSQLMAAIHHDGVDLIEARLDAISATTIKGKSYWSSTEFWHTSPTSHQQQVWCVGFDYSGRDFYVSQQNARTNARPVRPFLNF